MTKQHILWAVAILIWGGCPAIFVGYCAESWGCGLATFLAGLALMGCILAAMGSGQTHQPMQDGDGILPSGRRRSEYHDYGMTDEDIGFWGLDQPGAPPPEIAGWVVGDMMDDMDW